jgi:hypothetical protein
MFEEQLNQAFKLLERDYDGVQRVLEKLTQEALDNLDAKIAANADALITIGNKEWLRQRRKKANMTELEQKEAVRKLEDEKLDDKGA